jgi:hypothetical protein
MKEIVKENMVFYSKTQITNRNKTSKIYHNVVIIRDTNFDKILNQIEGEEEIEKIKFKLKKKRKGK